MIRSLALSEADTRAKLIDPAIYARGWSEDMICRETTLGAVEIIAGKAAVVPAEGPITPCASGSTTSRSPLLSP